jgi:polysaccharide export outer membrane protein
MKSLTLAFIIVSLALYGCGPYSKNARVAGSPGTMAPPVAEEYRIHLGDELEIRLFYNPDLNQEVTVRPDGKISLLLVHDLSVVGLTAPELTNLLTESYAKHLQQPEVAVIVNTFAGHRVYVGGEVTKPSAHQLVGPTTVLQAIALSNGFKDTARTNEVVVLRRDADNKPFVIALDIAKAMKGIDLNQDIYLQPYDIVLVPKSNIADVNLWVTQYIKNNISFAPDIAQYYLILKK